MLVELAAAAALTAAATAGYAARGRSSQLFGPSVWRGAREGRLLALTFDDGPSPATLEVLGVLDLFAIRATFFQCGANVARLPAITRQVHEAGHELGNHTYHHPRLPGCSRARIRTEIGETQEAIERAAGVRPRLFRAPYGLRWFGLRQALAEYGLTGVMWSVIGYDWEWESEEIARHVATHASPGGIVCLHDGDRTSPRVDRSRTVRALRLLIPRLYDRGFRFVPAGDMVLGVH
jgi:peptidoglycan/xylan/chitin deacetylase (PgdA/CDA1 family)